MSSLFRDEFGAPTQVGRRTAAAIVLVAALGTGVLVGRSAGTAPASSRAASPAKVETTQSQASAILPANTSAPVMAAMTADCTLGGGLITHPANYESAIAALLIPAKRSDATAFAADEESQVDHQTGAITAANAGRDVFIDCIPIGYRVESTTDTTASVSVWSEQIVAIDQQFSPQASYVTETLNLQLVAGTWLLASSAILDSAWAPSVNQAALPQGTTLPAQMKDFTLVSAS